MRIGIVVINWNGLELLKKYLKVLIQNSLNHNIYVIDNNSEDQSVSFIKNNHREVNIISLDKNYGFAEGYNRGILQVKEEFICIINNDVEVTKDWLKPIERKLKSSPDLIIQPKILDINKKCYFPVCGWGWSNLGSTLSVCRRIPNVANLDYNQAVWCWP